MRIERILCPTDLTADSEAALRYATTLGRAYDAQLTLMYCQSESASPESSIANPLGLLDATLRRHASDAEIERRHWQAKMVKCDDPGDCITREAARFGADLVIMRSRRRPHRAALLGSIAESVSRTAPCPVMVVHSDERDWVNGHGREIGLKRVLVAFDFSDQS